MLQLAKRNYLQVQEFSNMHLAKVADLIFSSYTDLNIIWNIIPSKKPEMKAAIMHRLHKCLNTSFSHVVTFGDRVVACILSIDIRDLESLIAEEKQHMAPVLFQYLNTLNQTFYDELIQANRSSSLPKSAVMLFAAVDAEFSCSLTFFHLIQWNIDQLLKQGFVDYYGITGTSRFLSLVSDKIEVKSSTKIEDKGLFKELDNHKLFLIKHKLKPLVQRAYL